jgi:hypothetical protein
MGEATYRWICTYCDTSDVAESPEMAKLAVDVHVSLFHGPARQGVRTQAGSEGNVLMQQGEGWGTTSTPRPAASHSPNEPPASIPPSGGNWWRALVNFMRRGGFRA